MKKKQNKDNDKYFDEKKSKLPKDLLKKGIGCSYYDIYTTKDDLKQKLIREENELDKLKALFNEAKKKLDKKTYRHFRQGNRWKLSCARREIKELKKDIEEFNIKYFNAFDVEDGFRKMLNK